jgi:hypothetical protein
LFNDLEYFNAIEPADYLTISLYQNSDAQNILWEYEFATANLHIDSDNNNGFDLPDKSEEEEAVEAKTGDPDNPGKILYVDYEDSDGDGKPNFADNDAGAANPFIPMVLTAEIGSGNSRVIFRYSASDPAKIEGPYGDEVHGFVYVPAPGMLRLWTKNGTDVRDNRSVLDGGDYIPSDIPIPVRLLGATFENPEVTLYVESVSISSGPGDTEIQVEYQHL